MNRSHGAGDPHSESQSRHEQPEQAEAPEQSRPIQPLSRVPTGIAGLDTILNGGFLRGGIYFISGQPGTGKTILSNQMAFNHVASGGRAVFVSILSETHARMFPPQFPLFLQHRAHRRHILLHQRLWYCAEGGHRGTAQPLAGCRSR